MKFEINHKVGTDYLTVRFTAEVFKLPVIESFEISFQRLGGEFQDDFTWKFPVYITSEVLSEVIRNTCFVCGGLMKNGTSYQNTLISSEDFGNDIGQRGTTQSRMGKAKQIKVRKCLSCGHSHT